MNGIDSRRLILDRIKVALNADTDAGEARREQQRSDWMNLPRSYRQTGTLDEADRIELFEARIRHYNATTCHSSGDIAEDIAEILTERRKRVLAIPRGFPEFWLPRNFMFIADESLRYDQLASCDGVLTSCTVGIALTGTIVLDSGPDQGRRAATLIPDYHLCVLRREDIVEFVPEAFEKLESVKTQPLTFISGPSATVDIEMTRVRGVHGPRTLDVLIA